MVRLAQIVLGVSEGVPLAGPLQEGGAPTSDQAGSGGHLQKRARLEMAGSTGPFPGAANHADPR